MTIRPIYDLSSNRTWLCILWAFKPMSARFGGGECFTKFIRLIPVPGK